MAAGSNATSSPLTPLRIRSGAAPACEVTTGRPALRASSSTRLNASYRLGKTKKSAASSQGRGSACRPAKCTRSASPRSPTLRCACAIMSLVPPTTTRWTSAGNCNKARTASGNPLRANSWPMNSPSGPAGSCNSSLNRLVGMPAGW
ncbi:hypothetical protein SDC9_208508 [bioreactor metagenome]|uniref:Uncharacterized protein n=1 Tax=bioreactor metagenome TaxID=1076179 RepID=A0A645JBF8_9ZZZZ